MRLSWQKALISVLSGRSAMTVLSVDEHLFLFGANHFGDLAQAGPLPAVAFIPRAIAQPLRRMIADLLQTPQNVRPHQLAQGVVGTVGPLRQALGEAREFRGGSHQPRIHKIENGPQVPQAVLDGCAGEGQPDAALKLRPARPTARSALQARGGEAASRSW